MFNEWFGFLFIIVNFTIFLAMYRLFGRMGLFVWVGVATILANLQVVKTIEVFGLTATLGNTMYGTAFLATDLLNERYGKEDAKKAVWLGFFTLVMMTVIMQMVLLFEPSPSDMAQESLGQLFGLLPRIAAGSLAAYLVSQFADVYIFSYLKKKFPKDSQFWIRNNGSTMISQLLDTLVFTSIAFLGAFPAGIWFQIFLSTYALKWIVALIDTPFGYIAKRFPK
ncbi:queuosine precursor transporter [Bacillus badius]|uniref:Probable queuosine precursor transporter n=1 Tax=Bacillus badius TaxID=1455 RepID=A0ABR5AYY2_BACBA|nr:queuosine precursor transporter [Bacillus badius]KIL75075.1 putative preQ0 transporter [Bacillus badius]KIL79943.1 putative preQ0 transporter [Bacillus badius]MED4714987.1 queuosine precursor transporter [Bacillus badius]